ncbi:MAG: outer membrane protein assembly factor BamD [Verrucomicrobiota bacterium]|nr:outer membrane protein assembly factor BamD [Verrucomicrobiota bacterium]
MLLCGLALWCGRHGLGFDDRADSMGALEADKAPERARKTLGWFSRQPAMANPVEQLAYARQLERDGRVGAAEDECLALARKWPDAAQAPDAQFAYARLLESRRKYAKAFEEYQYLIEHYAGRFPYGEALDRQFRIARVIMDERSMTFWGLFPGVRSPEAALPLLEKIVENAPRWERTPEAWLHIGMIREELGDHADAIRAYEQIQLRHSKSPYAPSAAFRRACCLGRESDANPRDEYRCRHALSALAAFLADYPENENTAESRRRLNDLRARLDGQYYSRAVFYDQIARRPEAAVIAYTDFLKKFPRSRHAEQARARIEALKASTADED